ncbi:hypothetical protein [Methylophaga thiooxydans]|uniref:HTH Mu-type domain-containing protein n=1 Tax=Methylophaga thiooxydans DMS010 TaxID=637616 RepID=C0N8E7_9GAMM|nr:hypothetical protein [Methylophaga thiooxydans]EEF78992.1 hypothetical protein MDMS009_2509 [Methylophaga thiooxydans DMS010]
MTEQNREWFTATELANKPGLPKYKRGVNQQAQNKAGIQGK